VSLRLPIDARAPGARRRIRARAALGCALHAWVLWSGAASALESQAYGNVGPTLVWGERGNYADEPQCGLARGEAVNELVRTDPQAVKRGEDTVVTDKRLPGEDEMVVHSVVRFVCLPEGTKPPNYEAPPDRKKEPEAAASSRPINP